MLKISAKQHYCKAVLAGIIILFQYIIAHPLLSFKRQFDRTLERWLVVAHYVENIRCWVKKRQLANKLPGF